MREGCTRQRENCIPARIRDLFFEEKGGKVTGSVTGKTTCLINNDNTSNSAKNKKARELNVPVITEEEFMRKYLDWEE